MSEPDDIPRDETMPGRRAADWSRRDEFYAQHPEIVRARMFAIGNVLGVPSDGLMSPDDMKNAFLYTLTLGGTVSAALAAAGVDRVVLRKWKEADPNFARYAEEAEEAGTDRLEDEAYRRAYEGVEEPIFHQGELIAVVRRPSDRLLEFLLKGRRRWKYGDKTSITAGEPDEEPLKVISRVIVSPRKGE